MLYNVLSIASWYPNPTDAFDGDFVQRHTHAIARKNNVISVHILNDDSGKYNDAPLRVRRVHAHLTEYTYFIQKSKTGFRFWDSYVNNKRYIKWGTECIEAILKEEGFQPDIIHAHITIKAGLLAVALKKKWNIPLALTEHWTAYLKPLGFKMKHFSKKVWKKVDRLLPVSHNLNAHIQKIQSVASEVIPNVVDVDAFFLPENKTTEPPFTFFHVSTLNENKNPEGLFRVVKKLADLNYSFLLRIAGQNQEKYIAYCQELGIPAHYLDFVGTIPYTKVATHMQTANAFVLFSNFENLPCVLLESLCCGTPIITTNAGGCGEIVTPENGILIEQKDETALFEAMKKMIEQPHLYNAFAIAENAQEKYSYEAVALSYHAVYQGLIEIK